MGPLRIGGILGIFPPILYLVICPGETPTHLCGVVGGGPLSTGQAIEGNVGTGVESEFWARTTEGPVEARTKRSNNRIIPGVYNCGLLSSPYKIRVCKMPTL